MTISQYYNDIISRLNASCICGGHDSGKFFFFNNPHCTNAALLAFPSPSAAILFSAAAVSADVRAS